MTKRPSIISAMPSHEEGESISPMKNTPSNEAVSGSAKDSVTAAEAGTPVSPFANKKYAEHVAINPM